MRINGKGHRESMGEGVLKEVDHIFRPTQQIIWVFGNGRITLGLVVVLLYVLRPSYIQPLYMFRDLIVTVQGENGLTLFPNGRNIWIKWFDGTLIAHANQLVFKNLTYCRDVWALQIPHTRLTKILPNSTTAPYGPYNHHQVSWYESHVLNSPWVQEFS